MRRTESILTFLALTGALCVLLAQFLIRNGFAKPVSFEQSGQSVNYLDSTIYRQSQFLRVRVTGDGSKLLINGEEAKASLIDGEYATYTVFHGDIVEIDLRAVASGEATVYVGAVGEGVNFPPVGTKLSVSGGIVRLFRISTVQDGAGEQ